MQTIPARSSASQSLRAGECIKIINTNGEQVLDTWAFSTGHLNGTGFPTFMSMSHSRSTPHQLLPTIGESFLDNKRNIILTLLEDTSPGSHDALFAACSKERYLQIGAPADHDNCASNLYNAVAQLGSTFDKVGEFLRYGWMPDPLNLFMKVTIQGNQLINEAPESAPGDFVIFKAVQDCVVIMSACPMDVGQCNSGASADVAYGVFPL